MLAARLSQGLASWLFSSFHSVTDYDGEEVDAVRGHCRRMYINFYPFIWY